MKVKYDDAGYYNNGEARAERDTVTCAQCGGTRLFVNWIPGPWCGGYLKVSCLCGAEQVLFDDYA